MAAVPALPKATGVQEVGVVGAAPSAEEAVGPQPVASMFTDVFARPTWLLEEQKANYLARTSRILASSSSDV